MPDGTDIDPSSDVPTRRSVLRGAMLAGASVPFLVACGSGSSSAGAGTEPSESTTPAASRGKGGTDSGTKLISTSQVPEGGGVIFDSKEVVVTQPTAGEFKCFSAICTHSGCTVASVSGGTINCTCHGSQFSMEDGSVVAGPAPSPLPPKNIVVKGTSVNLI
jgi:Rieske Fe-S protein